MVSIPRTFSFPFVSLHIPTVTPNDHAPTLIYRNFTTCVARAVTFSCDDPLRCVPIPPDTLSRSFFDLQVQHALEFSEEHFVHMLNGFVTEKSSIDTKYAFQTTLSQIKNENQIAVVLHVHRGQRQNLGPLLITQFLSNDT